MDPLPLLPIPFYQGEPLLYAKPTPEEASLLQCRPVVYYDNLFEVCYSSVL